MSHYRGKNSALDGDQPCTVIVRTQLFPCLRNNVRMHTRNASSSVSAFGHSYRKVFVEVVTSFLERWVTKVTV